MPYKDAQDARGKDAKRRYYLKNRTRYLAYARATAERYKELVRARKDGPCSDCAVRYPYFVMDFDHRPGTEKLHEIAKIHFTKSRAIIESELAKCDLVCANCHRVRSAKRMRAKKETDLGNSRPEGHLTL